MHRADEEPRTNFFCGEKKNIALKLRGTLLPVKSKIQSERLNRMRDITGSECKSFLCGFANVKASIEFAGHDVDLHSQGEPKRITIKTKTYDTKLAILQSIHYTQVVVSEA
jgi:hypothetical protein